MSDLSLHDFLYEHFDQHHQLLRRMNVSKQAPCNNELQLTLLLPVRSNIHISFLGPPLALGKLTVRTQLNAPIIVLSVYVLSR